MARSRRRKLFDAIEERRTIPLERLIYGLGIRHVGESTAGRWRAPMATGRPSRRRR
jgi:DNA ligase (NAD+)